MNEGRINKHVTIFFKDISIMYKIYKRNYYDSNTKYRNLFKVNNNILRHYNYCEYWTCNGRNKKRNNIKNINLESIPLLDFKRKETSNIPKYIFVLTEDNIINIYNKFITLIKKFNELLKIQEIYKFSYESVNNDDDKSDIRLYVQIDYNMYNHQDNFTFNLTIYNVKDSYIYNIIVVSKNYTILKSYYTIETNEGKSIINKINIPTKKIDFDKFLIKLKLIFHNK